MPGKFGDIDPVVEIKERGNIESIRNADFVIFRATEPIVFLTTFDQRFIYTIKEVFLSFLNRFSVTSKEMMTEALVRPY